MNAVTAISSLTVHCPARRRSVAETARRSHKCVATVYWTTCRYSMIREYLASSQGVPGRVYYTVILVKRSKKVVDHVYLHS